MKVHIIDLDVCNIFSISKCIDYLGFKVEIVREPNQLVKADKIIFPGVGSYNNVMKKIEENNWKKILTLKLINEKKRYLGICLGMQILTQFGSEFSKKSGLNFIGGEVNSLNNGDDEIILPHTGWNSVNVINNDNLFKNIKTSANFYFNHSYAVEKINDEYISSTTNYNKEFISSIRKNNICGVQFHPEKSSEDGIMLIKNFLTEI